MSKLKGAVIKKLQAGKDDAYASLKKVEFLIDFPMPKTTTPEIPETFRLPKDDLLEVSETDTFQSGSDFSASIEDSIDL
jgi:hypothetical protein